MTLYEPIARELCFVDLENARLGMPCRPFQQSFVSGNRRRRGLRPDICSALGLSPEVLTQAASCLVIFSRVGVPPDKAYDVMVSPPCCAPEVDASGFIKPEFQKSNRLIFEKMRRLERIEGRSVGRLSIAQLRIRCGAANSMVLQARQESLSTHFRENESMEVR